MLRALQLAMRMLGREWKSGELGVLMLALTVAVADPGIVLDHDVPQNGAPHAGNL